MAPYTYYYFFSIILVLLSLLYIFHVVYYRVKGATFFGQKFRPGTPEYKKLNKLVNNGGLTIAVVVSLVLVANLVYSISRVIGLDTPDARFVLVFAPVFTILLIIIIFYKTRGMFDNTGKHD